MRRSGTFPSASVYHRTESSPSLLSAAGVCWVMFTPSMLQVDVSVTAEDAINYIIMFHNEYPSCLSHLWGIQLQVDTI